MNANICKAREDSSLTKLELASCMENAFKATFLSHDLKEPFLKELADYLHTTRVTTERCMPCGIGWNWLKECY